MLTSSDFKELLSLFKKYNVRYLIVGGYAVMRYAEPRFTKDLDVFVAVDDTNARAVYTALSEFGALPFFWCLERGVPAELSLPNSTECRTV